MDQFSETDSNTWPFPLSRQDWVARRQSCLAHHMRPARSLVGRWPSCNDGFALGVSHPAERQPNQQPDGEDLAFWGPLVQTVAGNSEC